MERGKIRRDRLDFEDKFTQIPNHWLRDERISHRARGILGLLLSHKAGFEINLLDLVTGREKQEAVRTAVRELEAVGYLTRERERDEFGRLKAADWRLSEPTGDDRPQVGNPVDNSEPTGD